MAKKAAKSTKSETDSSTAAKPMKKADAVREALKRGIKLPSAAVAFIKSEFGIDMPRQQFSVYKHEFSKRKGGKSMKVRAASPMPAMSQSGGKNRGTDVLGAMEAIKPLVAEFGADKVKRIVDLLG
jgi:hypothetical protein